MDEKEIKIEFDIFSTKLCGCREKRTKCIRKNTETYRKK